MGWLLESGQSNQNMVKKKSPLGIFWAYTGGVTFAGGLVLSSGMRG
jgi:hypothetical protein